MSATTSTTRRISFDSTTASTTTPVDVDATMTDSSSAKDLSALLHQTKACDIPVANHQHNNVNVVVELEAHMKPLESAKVLGKAGILGAPVWNKNRQVYVGFFDMRDLISTVLVAPKNKQETDDSWLSEHLTTSYLAARNPFIPLHNTNATLWQVCRALCQKDTHRVPLVDAQTKRCVRIVSQSAVVKFLAQHLTTVTQFPALAQTLGEAQFPYRKTVLQAADTASARDVFTLMDQHRLSGIAIVDGETGKHIGNTSAVDIKLAIRTTDDGDEQDGGGGTIEGADMDMDILSYLAAVRQERNFLHDQYPCAHVRESSTVGHALKMLAKTGFHRVFVVDDQGRPVGVISVTDMIKFVVAQVPHQEK